MPRRLLLALLFPLLAMTRACFHLAAGDVSLGASTYVCLVMHRLAWDGSAATSPSSSPTLPPTPSPSALTAAPSGVPTAQPSAPSGQPTFLPTPSHTNESPTGQPTASSPALHGSYRRVVNVLKADQLSRISVKGSWVSADYSSDPALLALNVSSSLSAGFAVSVESNGVMSYQKAFRSVQSSNGTEIGVTFPLLMAIIQVDNGVVKVLHVLDPLDSFSNCYRAFSGMTRADGVTLLIALRILMTSMVRISTQALTALSLIAPALRATTQRQCRYRAPTQLFQSTAAVSLMYRSFICYHLFH